MLFFIISSFLFPIGNDFSPFYRKNNLYAMQVFQNQYMIKAPLLLLIPYPNLPYLKCNRAHSAIFYHYNIHSRSGII